MVFLAVHLILLLNLLIAILSSTYSLHESHGVGLYLESVIDILPMWEYHKSYNFLTWRFPPFNILNLFLFCCLRKSSARLGKCMEIIYYIPVFLFSYVNLIFWNVLFFPIGYYGFLQ